MLLRSVLARVGSRLPSQKLATSVGNVTRSLTNLRTCGGLYRIQPESFITRKFSTSRVLSQLAETVPHTHPKRLLNSSKWVGYWLIGTSGLVFGIVVLGGLTRLTESGLSITEWKPVTGTLPPLTQQEWEEEFEKYKESPEFKQINSHIDLDEFKFIFFMEWIHRLWGRAIGAVFILPAIYFAVSRKTSSRVNRRLFGLAALLGFQGFIGWWMVKSGLDQEDLKARNSKPTVSPYRLATHLGTAFLLYMGMMWTGLEILREHKWVKDPAGALKLFKMLDNPLLRPLRKMSLGVLALTFGTAMSGALVAGLDAGWIYNTFPKMGDNWVPPKRELMDPNFARKENKQDMWWRNMLENPTTVQLNHRILGVTAFCAVFALHMYCVKRKAIIPKASDRCVKAMMGLVTLQVGLGITTLIWLVPISLASAHQAGALALFTSAIVFASQLRKPRIPMRILINGLQMQQARRGGSKILSEAANFKK
ncbi:COX15 (YER141W) [Zygosaccharomyces parabailii]|uniref:ZYBA0S05-08108g1_1 n=1 Tax=Zygosaccharomyces bailii (strain CLIB 213 / ATCC 58445 / CBS 680 / BCRC 21525 / NBRC 1098 / NCYC 1416 / NRRL Y-2227) TaxID=1333698 RepID=A0A8J2X8R1_ZYGB2|nr:COX15 (YER141W) [Zygosaccharomyces parabailii]CDF90061.1 ZYBA0S05-08108g1_1 [Zygosaccharomyces bailii CLIB 213]CDH15250.1 probable Cytochrome c oxidase assembly protein COX15 [Zygosaccharomyces bailii ISA1307]SJM87295.1 probable Cytochrome c oxidase assembly protein COX15 [Zygosaccharomyces bailii]